MNARGMIHYRRLTFSPPERFEMLFQLFFGGITLNEMPSEKGSRLSTSSSSALPPRVIIYGTVHDELRIHCSRFFHPSLPDTSP